MRIRPVGAELSHADGRTDGRRERQTDRHDEANSRFSQFLQTSLKTSIIFAGLFRFAKEYDTLRLHSKNKSVKDVGGNI